MISGNVSQYMIKGTISPADLLSAQWVHLRPRRSFAVVGMVLIALSIWGCVIMFRPPMDQELGAGRWFLPGFLAYLAIWFAVLIPYRSRRSYRQRKDFQREITFSASDAGLSVQNENAQGTKPWSDYLKWKEGKQTFLLYLSDSMFQLVPKRFFATEAELAQFRALLENNVPRCKA